MEIIKLNKYGNLNNVYQLVVTEMKKGNFKRFRFECDHCILSILTCSHFNSYELQTIEVGLFDKNEEWFKTCDDWYDNDDSIIHYLSVVGLPLLIKSFYNADEEDIPELFQSFKRIAYLS